MTFLLRLFGLDGVTRVESVQQWAWQAAASPVAWAVATVVALGVLLAAVNWLPWLKMRRHVRLATFALRLGMIGLVLMALYRIELSLRLRVEKPQRWRVLIDDSGSMQTTDVNGQPRYRAALADLEKIRAIAGADVRLDAVTLSGRSVGDAAGQGATHLYDAIVEHALHREPIDRLMILTDGRDVAAHDFERLGRELRTSGIDAAARVYGSAQKVASTAVFAEPEREVVRLGEKLVILGSILTSDPADAYSVHLLEDGEEVLTVSIPKAECEAFTVSYRPEKEGLHQYTLRIPSGQESVGSHETSFMARVTPEKIRVLLIEGYPRYEFKLMRYVLDNDPMIDLISIAHLPGGGVYVQGEPLHANAEQGLINSRTELFKYDVVILRDMPRTLFRADGDMSENRMRLLADFVTDRGGGLIMGGGNDVYRAGGYEGSPLAAIMPFDLGTAFGTDPQFPGRFFVNVNRGMYEQPILRLLPDSAANRERWRNLRELDGCNNVGRARPLATTLLSRRLERENAAGEKVEMTVPILAYQPFGEGKVIAASVDTLWRWQLQPDYPEAPPLQTLLANMVRYVAPRPSKSGEPEIQLMDRAPQIGGEALLFTQLRDARYQPVRNADLVVSVAYPNDRVERIYPRDLPEQPGYYEYRVPLDMGGRYQVKAEYGKHVQETTFIAGATRDEYADLSSDPDAMAAMTEASGGEIVQDMDEWLQRVRQQPVTFVSRRTLPVWNSPLVMILFIGFVAGDCYLRKRQGLA